MYSRRFFLKKFLSYSSVVTLLSSFNCKNLFFLNNKYTFNVKNFFSMGTYGKICVLTKNNEYANVFIQTALERIYYLEEILTKFTNISDVGKLNKQRQGVFVSTDTIKVLKLSNALRIKTCNYFNVGASCLYSILKDEDNIRIDKFVDNKVSLIGSKFTIDLGGIGKGFAIEEASRVLLSQGVNNFYIELGGDIYVHTSLTESFLWEVSVNCGANIVGQYLTCNEKKIFLKRGGISSSGFSNVRFKDNLEKNEKNTHIFDPVTLEYKNYYKYVTIVGENLSICDALSTACFNVPPKYLDDFKNSFNNYTFYVFY